MVTSVKTTGLVIANLIYGNSAERTSCHIITSKLYILSGFRWPLTGKMYSSPNVTVFGLWAIADLLSAF